MMPGGPIDNPTDKLREPKPKNLKEVPGFIFRIVSKFFYRLFYIFALVWETKPLVLFALTAFAILLGVIPVLSAKISAEVLNALANDYSSIKAGMGDYDKMLSDVMKLLVWQFVVIFAIKILNTFRSYTTRIAGELVANHTNVKIMNKAKEVDIASFDRPEFYEKLENATREAGNRPIQILSATFNGISTIITMVSFIIILAGVSTAAPWIIVAVSLPSAIITFVYRKKTFSFMRRRSKDRRQLSYYSSLVTNKDMVKEIRLYGLSDTFINRYQQVFRRYYKGLRKLFLTEDMWNIFVAVISAAVNCLLYVFIAKGVLTGSTQVGNYSLYTGALGSISNGMASFISATATIYEGTLFIDNLISFMKEKRNIVSSLPTPLHAEKGISHRIELKNVSFRYPGTERDVIKNVSAVIEPGSTVVLVGLNGAGKTTLIKLITRLYDPTDGEILLDGRNIKEYDTDELYSLYGIIFQDFGRYAFSVRDNIAFSNIRSPIKDEDIMTAARSGAADEFIASLPKGYDTPLMRYFEEDGIELSTGQWQKLSVARAFYSDSDILILDEPTASLDAIAEQEIYDRFDSLRKDKTTLFVSHRLSSATTADMILVLENGEIIERGTHSELMAMKGRYCELFTTQASRYIVDGVELDESVIKHRKPQ